VRIAPETQKCAVWATTRAVLSKLFPIYEIASYINDGFRSLLFFDGRSAAGLGDAFRVLGGYLVGAVILGYLVALVKDSFAGRKGRKVSGEAAEGSTG
jgi:hypothetical protein